MTDQEILDALKPLLVDGKLPCKRALDFAAQSGLNPAQVGKVCNQNEIRIINCQLGCFTTKRTRPK